MAETTRTVQLLQASVDELEESHFRFLVDGVSVKYVTIAGGLFATDDLCFAPSLVSLLPPFPDGDWNEGYIGRSVDSNCPVFLRTIKTQFPSIESWHSTVIDHLDVTFDQKLRSGVYEASSSRFQRQVVAKFARFAWEIPALERECQAYRWIEGQGIGPTFLGLLAEEGRIIGLLIEKINDARHASEEDLTLCQHTLSKLHNLGILHGDVNNHNFLIENGHAVLIDFDFAQMSKDQEAFREEMDRLPRELCDLSGKGGRVVIGGEM